MGFQFASLSSDLVSNQASVALQSNSHDGQYASVAVSFNFAEGHYSRRQLLDKAKRLIDDAATFLNAEIAKSP